jgi:hypothetical protein
MGLNHINNFLFVKSNSVKTAIRKPIFRPHRDSGSQVDKTAGVTFIAETVQFTHYSVTSIIHAKKS